jgi:hypothetical protein
MQAARFVQLLTSAMPPHAFPVVSPVTGRVPASPDSIQEYLRNL